VKVSIEAARHYHRPLLVPSVWPAGWQVLELNPAHVAEQRRAQGRRRVETDALAARAKLAEMDQITERRNTTQLGMPTFTQAAGRTNISPPGPRNRP
jgi:hypothetical protein